MSKVWQKLKKLASADPPEQSSNNQPETGAFPTSEVTITISTNRPDKRNVDPLDDVAVKKFFTLVWASIGVPGCVSQVRILKMWIQAIEPRSATPSVPFQDISAFPTSVLEDAPVWWPSTVPYKDLMAFKDFHCRRLDELDESAEVAWSCFTGYDVVSKGKSVKGRVRDESYVASEDAPWTAMLEKATEDKEQFKWAEEFLVSAAVGNMEATCSDLEVIYALGRARERARSRIGRG